VVFWCRVDTAPAYPTDLYDSSYAQAKQIELNAGATAVDLDDAASNQFIRKEVHGAAKIELPADSARLIVIVPTGASVSKNERCQLLANC
jgi:hypothetical protein